MLVILFVGLKEIGRLIDIIRDNNLSYKVFVFFRKKLGYF